MLTSENITNRQVKHSPTIGRKQNTKGATRQVYLCGHRHTYHTRRINAAYRQIPPPKFAFLPTPPMHILSYPYCRSSRPPSCGPHIQPIYIRSPGASISSGSTLLLIPQTCGWWWLIVFRLADVHTPQPCGRPGCFFELHKGAHAPALHFRCKLTFSAG